jgi:hypothetical protein
VAVIPGSIAGDEVVTSASSLRNGAAVLVDNR